MIRFAFLAVLLAAFGGCDTCRYLAGTTLEDFRRPALAVRQYEAFLARRPKDPRACEVRLRTAEIYRRFFGRCLEARRHYEAAARDFPRATACAARAKAGLLVCPDYFPTEPGRTWVYVDSASGGKAMRLEWAALPNAIPDRQPDGALRAPAAQAAIQTALYAGNKRIQQKTDRYERADWAVWRVDKDGREAILRYPYSEALAWKASRGKARVDYLIVSDSTTVTAAAGRFSGCLKVRERDSTFARSWKYDYYCPGVGRVKTTVGGPGFENPNTELLRYEGGLVESSK